MDTVIENRRAKGQKAKGIISNIFLVFSILIVLMAAVWTLFFNTPDAFLFGYKPYIVASESMQPGIMKYAFVIIEKGGYADVETGEVIAFKTSRMSGQSVLHRVVDVTPEGFVTKGDAVRIADDKVVTGDEFLGRKIWHTNLTAIVYGLLQTPKGIFLVVGLPSLIIAFLIITTKAVKKAIKR